MKKNGKVQGVFYRDFTKRLNIYGWGTDFPIFTFSFISYLITKKRLIILPIFHLDFFKILLYYGKKRKPLKGERVKRKLIVVK
jgi:hypothetical protein